MSLLVRKFARDAVSDVKLRIIIEYDLDADADSRFRQRPTVHVNGVSINFRVSKEGFVRKLYARFGRFSTDEKSYTVCIQEHQQELKQYNFSNKHGIMELELHSDSTKKGFEIEMVIYVLPHIHNPINLVRHLHGDEALTDFELQGNDDTLCTIRVHKSILASCSDVFKHIVYSDLVENHGGVEIPYSVAVLRQFKDYIYLGEIPKTELEQFVLFARQYRLPHLERDCIARMISNLTIGTSKALLKFSFEHGIDQLTDEVLKWYVDGAISMETLERPGEIVLDENENL